MNLTSRPPLTVRFHSPKHKTGTKLKMPPLGTMEALSFNRAYRRCQNMELKGDMEFQRFWQYIMGFWWVGGKTISGETWWSGLPAMQFLKWARKQSLQPLSEGEKVCIGFFFFPPDIVNPCCQNYSVLKGFLPIKFKFTGHRYWMSGSTGIQVKVKQDFLFPFILQLLCQISSVCASTEGLLYPLASDWFSHVDANSCRLEEEKTVRLANILPKLTLCHYWDVLSHNPFTFRVPMTLSPPSSGLGVLTAS